MARSYRDAAIEEQRRRVDLANRTHAANEALRRGDAMADQEFRRWYAQQVERTATPDFRLDANPDAREHYYDYRAAHRAGAQPTFDKSDGRYHWPSEFKRDDHPRRFLPIGQGGRMVDTRTGQPVSNVYQPQEQDAQPRMQTGLYRPGAVQPTTADLRNPNVGDPQAEEQMRMQSQLSPQEYAVLQNLLSEADRWHGTNEGGQRVFTGRRGMTPDEINRMRMQGGQVRMVSPKAAARDDAREDARRQKAARMEAERAAREQREAESAPSRNRRVLMKGQV